MNNPALVRLKFVDNIFEEVVQLRADKPVKEFEAELREELKNTRGKKTTLCHYTLDILVERPTDSVGLRRRRTTIPDDVYRKFSLKPPTRE